MIENQSDNIDIKEDDVSNQDNATEETSSAEDKIIKKIEEDLNKKKDLFNNLELTSN